MDSTHLTRLAEIAAEIDIEGRPDLADIVDQCRVSVAQGLGQYLAMEKNLVEDSVKNVGKQIGNTITNWGTRLLNPHGLPNNGQQLTVPQLQAIYHDPNTPQNKKQWAAAQLWAKGINPQTGAKTQPPTPQSG